MSQASTVGPLRSHPRYSSACGGTRDTQHGLSRLKLPSTCYSALMVGGVGVEATHAGDLVAEALLGEDFREAILGVATGMPGRWWDRR